ncbi:MAG TPA: PAS domain S-box protein [Acidobacteriota bacterium]|nr:PAS domain S-box protein [Acidobacteriota bacterium]
MEDEEKTKDELLSEITGLRKEIAEREEPVTDYKQILERFRDSQERYEIFMEEAPIGICNMDISGKVTYVNRRFEELSGYSREEIVGKYRFKLGVFPPETLEIFAEQAKGRSQTEPTRLVETQFRCKDRRWIYLEVEARPIYRKDELVGLQLAARDITERRQIMEALRKSEERLKLLFEIAPDAFYLLDMKGIIIDWNNTAEEITGFRKHEVIGNNFLVSKLLPSSQIPKAAELLAKNAIGQSTEPEDFIFNRKNGTQVTVELRTFPLKVGGRDLAAGIARDITVRKHAEDALQGVVNELKERLEERTAELSNTSGLLEQEISERKRNEERLKEREEKFRSILGAVKEGYYELDLEGNLTLFSDSLCKIYGYEKEELTDMNYRQFMSQETADKAYQLFNGVYESGIPAREVDLEIMRKDGAKRQVRVYASLIKDTEGHRTGFRGIVQDVTELRLAEKGKNFLKNIFNSSPDCIITTDTHGKALYISPNIRNILGYNAPEITGKTVHFLYPEGIEDAKKIMRDLSERGELVNHEIKVKKKDGQLIDINLSASLMMDEKGLVIGTLGIFRDVTERNKLQAQLQQSAKLQAIRTLAGGIAHHFNNLLAGIQGNASLVLLDLTSTHPHYEKVKQIEQFVQNGADLVRGLLGFSEDIGKYELESANINDIVKGSLKIFDSSKEEITIHSRYQEDIWIIDVDREKIQQVLFSLYENAYDVMAGKGDLYIETNNVRLDSYHVEPFGLEPGAYVKISVTDTGVGLEKAAKERVYEPFFTTKEVGKGTGLSLASAYGIIRDHKGIIRVDSEKGKGTTFTIYLPASEEGATQKDMLPGERGSYSETVLLVDDEDIVIDIGTQMLEKIGYKVLSAKSGEEAARVYRQNVDTIDLVILDMFMPDMSGSEAYDALKRVNPDVKILLSSGYDVSDKATELLQRGCDGFIQKPLTMKELSQKIGGILKK